jgi:2-ketocyclohexanecarboxyl-CoA hydrolase
MELAKAVYTDILYTKADGIATITINRPKAYNAFTANTCEELIHAFKDADFDRSVGVVVLTGAGEKAFCTGGDQGTQDGGYGGRGVIGLPIEEVQSAIRDCNKPVIADLAIASDNAQLGQVGPKVGSVDPGFGTALLARVVGEKKAREIWYLCRRYSAQEALQMGLVNAVVPLDQLDAEVKKWCDEILEKSPTAIALAKKSFNVDTEMIRGMGGLAMHALKMYYQTDESAEGGNAFREKRKPDFRKHAK